VGFLQNMKVAKKLTLLIIIAVIGLCAVGLTGYYYLADAKQNMDSMYKERLLSVKWLNDSRNQARAIEADFFDMMLTNDANEKTRLKEDIDKRVKTFGQDISDYEKTQLDPFEVDTLKELHANLAMYREGRQEAIALAQQNKNTAAYDSFNKNARAYGEAVHKDLRALAEFNTKAAADINQQNQSDFQKAMMIFVGIIFVALLLIVSLGWAIARNITLPLHAAIAHIGEMAKGNFSIDVPKENLQSRDEFGLLAKAFDDMNKNIRGLIRQMTQTSDQVAAASEEMTASAEQSSQAANQVAGSITEVAQGAEKQLKAADESSAIVEQLSAGIHQVANNTNEVSAMAEKTARTASDGGQAIDKAVSQMSVIERSSAEVAKVVERLGESSKQIGQIVGTISGIAGQTNLLALNAAIEAARAGEQGRGFAVVAEEVRKLAEQSEDAAKQIADLIGGVQHETNQAVSTMHAGQKDVQSGTEIVNLAGQSFREIVKMIGQMTTQVREISAAIEEMAAGSQQIVNSVKEIVTENRKSAGQTQTISAATEEQSASMEEIAAASRGLATMAEELQTAIGKFSI